MDNIFIDTNIDFEPIPEVIRLSGVTFEGRQDVIPNLIIDSFISLTRDPFNEWDKYAIKVFYQDIQIGWIPKATAKILAPEIDAGVKWNGRIKQITGGNDKNWGILIKLNVEV
jgi:single-stranded-DNA-specific exonuclease